MPMPFCTSRFTNVAPIFRRHREIVVAERLQPELHAADE